MSLSSLTTAEATLSFDEHIRARLAEFEKDILFFLGPLAEALGPLHESGQLHGGIQPAALRYRQDGSLDREHFLAQRRYTEVRAAAHVQHAYLAPESLAGEAEDPRVDCYALGALLFCIIDGRPPASADRRAGRDESLSAERFSKWPRRVLEAVNRCLALEKEKRIANVQELWRELSPGEPAVREETEPAAASAETRSQNAGIPISTSAELRSQEMPRGEVAPPAREPAKEAISAPAAAAAPVPFPGRLEVRDRLPNASVGKPYRQNIREIFGEQAGRIGRIVLSVPPESGLVFDEAENVLHGTPKVAGEISLSLKFQLSGALAERSALTHSVALTINPDPMSLWKDHASDPNGPFAKPDTKAEPLVTPVLTALAASRRGRSHAHAGTYRDDDFAMRFIEATGWHLFIVADGAGSAKYSRRGSEVACKKAVEELEKRLGASNDLDDALGKLGSSESEENLEKLRRIACYILAASAHAALTAIGAEANQCQGAVLRDFNTTFIAVLAKKLDAKWLLASFAIGDGGAGAMLDAQRVKVLTKADGGEFAGQTVFLTTPQVFKDSSLESFLPRTQVEFCNDFRFLAVMTDGITDPVFPSDAALAEPEMWEAWARELAREVPLEQPEAGMETALLEYLRFPSPGNHDDRTLILAVPKISRPQP